MNGHGDQENVTGFDNEPLITKNKDENLLLKRIIYARSCDAAAQLGDSAVKNGALAFIGYKKSYRLSHSPTSITRPLQDKIAELFLTPSNLIPISILKGNSVRHANSNSLSAMWHNIQNQVLLGDDSAKL